MFNQFIVVGKAYELNVTDKFIILDVNRNYAMFNTEARDLIKIDLSNFPEEMLWSIPCGAVVMVKGRIINEKEVTSLLAERIINTNNEPVIKKEELKYSVGQRVFLKDALGNVYKGTIISANECREPNLRYVVSVESSKFRDPIAVGEDKIVPIEEE